MNWPDQKDEKLKDEWPAKIEGVVAVIEDAPFLTAEQRADILNNNAARFLRVK